jgi:serine/threonine-protein kinase
VPQPAEVGATGELLAVVGDGLDASQAQGARRAAPRSRLALVVAGAAAVALVGGGLAASGLHARGPAIEAHRGVANEARARIAAVGHGVSAAGEEPADRTPPAPGAPPVDPDVSPEGRASRPEPAPDAAPSAPKASASADAPASSPARRKPAPTRKPYVKFD